MARRSPRERVAEICLALPEATCRGGQHDAYSVRNKKFAYYLDDHHGDGRLAINCKGMPGQNTALAASDPVRFHVPPYVGPRGWIGLYLDTGRVDWTEVAELLVDSYLLAAPKRLADEVRGQGAR
jgi:phosphoribosylglycinamide formyltransferase-1